MSIPAPLFLVVAAAVGIGNIWTNGPGLWRDYQIRNMTFVPAPDLIVQKAKCTTIWFVHTSCDIAYTASAAPGQPRPAVQSLSYAFLGPLPQNNYRLMRLGDRRDVVVADVGITYLTNRIAGLCVFTAIMAFAVFISLHRMGARHQEAAAPASRPA